MSTVIVDGKQMSYDEWRAQEREREAEEFAEMRRLKREALELLQRIGQAYGAYKEFLRQHPQLAVELPESEAGKQQFYQELRENLERADETPRCLHIKADGVQCGSPRMKSGDLCFAHQRMANAQALSLRLSSYEDGNGVQMGLMEVSRALVHGKITNRVAGLLLYGLQTAARNVGKVTFNQTPAEKMVTEETPVRAAGQEVKIAEGRLSYEKYRYDTMDPDLRSRFIELGEEMDRRYVAKMKAETGTGAAEAG
ncbi:MAG TPA: hypothetical protein VKW06_11185 [Candidatus Angelobacter sp.]|nr:hypothetical protein [Candidatus Angelobacter sp.]